MTDYNTQIVEPNDRFSKLAREICVESFDNSPALTVVRGGGGMRAMDGFRWNESALRSMIDQKVYEVVQSDGAGGKPQFFTLCSTPEAFRKLGWEVITMNADDLACRGGLATMIASSNIDTKAITDKNWPLCDALLHGFGDALKQSNLVLMTGETAIMPHCITAFCDNNSPEQLIMTWNATCIGLASTEIPENGTTIEPGMTIIGFRDEGYRCNGGTQFTNIILETWGDGFNNDVEAARFINRIVEPSRSYAGTVSRLNGWRLNGKLRSPLARLHGAAHITGGGIWSKLGEILPPGIGACLDAMPEPAPVLLEAQYLAEKAGMPMSDYACYGTFHGGCGLMLICKKSDIERVMVAARADGHDPYVIGSTTDCEKSEITIISRFAGRSNLSSLRPH